MLQPSQVTEVKGFVPTLTMLEIVKRVSELNEGDEKQDAQ